MRTRRRIRIGAVPALVLLFCAATGRAADETIADSGATAELQDSLNVVWTCVAAFLVFFMQAGFAMVEAGFTRAKNTVNILMKNLMDFSIGTVAFFIIGFGLMFGATNGLFGTTHFGLGGADWAGKDWNFTFLLFQTVFAGTAATIVSGAMAERTKFTGYLLYSVFICTIISKTAGLRVSADEELRGLDIGEHGMEAYSGFQIFTTQ